MHASTYVCQHAASFAAHGMPCTYTAASWRSWGVLPLLRISSCADQLPRADPTSFTPPRPRIYHVSGNVAQVGAALFASTSGMGNNLTVTLTKSSFAGNIATGNDDNQTAVCFYDANLLGKADYGSTKGLSPTQAPFPSSPSCTQYMAQT